MTKEASLEPLNDKEVEDFLARQRRAQEDSEWKTSTGIKETIAKAERLQKKIAKQKAAAKRKPRKLPFGEAWSNRFREQLLGRTITAVKYLNKVDKCPMFTFCRLQIIICRMFSSLGVLSCFYIVLLFPS